MHYINPAVLFSLVSLAANLVRIFNLVNLLRTLNVTNPSNGLYTTVPSYSLLILIENNQHGQPTKIPRFPSYGSA